MSREQHSAKIGSILLTLARHGTEGTNEVIPICARITTTYMADIYKDACAHYPNSGHSIRVLFLEHLNSTCAEKCSRSSRAIIEFGSCYVYNVT